MAQTHSLIASFIIGNLHSEVTVQELWEVLELKKYPGQQFIELLLAVDKRGHSKGHAFLQIPLGCSDRLLEQDGRLHRGLKMVITKEKGNAHLINNKKLVMSYKEQGMIKSTLFRPNLIYRYKPKENLGPASVEKSDNVVPQYDMCADLTHKKFAKDLDMVVAQCFKLGIEAIIIPGMCRKQRKEAMDIVNRYNVFIKMYFATGVAPNHADEYNAEEKTEIEKELSFNKCRCIGPIGLDYRLTKVTHEQQILAFEEQLQLACEKQMPLYLEEHDAHKDFVDVLKKHEDKLPKCAIIDFTGTAEELKCYVAMGFYIAISGSCGSNIAYIGAVITKALQDNEIPKDKVLLCSNAPRKTQINHDMGFRDILSSARDKLPLDKTRAEPLGIFLTQDVMAKYFGFKEQDEAKELGKIIVKNSKDFLTLPNQDPEKVTEEKEVEIVKKVEPESKTIENINKPYVFFALSVLLVAVFLEYVSGVPGMRSCYFFHRTLF